MLNRVFVAVIAVALPHGGTSHAADDGAAKANFEITGDAEKGEKVFRKCKACHEVGDGAASKAGPALNGVLGRTAGSVEDFKYSNALTEKATADELVWTPETLAEFLTKPKDYIKGTKMAFAGLRKEDDRANVIAYLAQFSGEASD
ncbi:MAG: cytochrome c family protein [Pseudomonadota bacterium]